MNLGKIDIPVCTASHIHLKEWQIKSELLCQTRLKPMRKQWMTISTTYRAFPLTALNTLSLLNRQVSIKTPEIGHD